jgi:hypothetical protein
MGPYLGTHVPRLPTVDHLPLHDELRVEVGEHVMEGAVDRSRARLVGREDERGSGRTGQDVSCDEQRHEASGLPAEPASEFTPFRKAFSVGFLHRS